jgi:uncharacterized peroxidase-related enzyme
VDGIKNYDRTVGVSRQNLAMLDSVSRLTLEPASVRESDTHGLRQQGFSDSAVHDILQVTGLFACSNRLTDGLGIEPQAAVRVNLMRGS